MDHMRISCNEPSSVVLRQIMMMYKFKMIAQKCQNKIMFHIPKFTLNDRIYPIECTYIRIKGIPWRRQILRVVKVRAI